MSNVINLIEKMAIEGDSQEVQAAKEEIAGKEQELDAIAQKDVHQLEKLLGANTKVMSFMAPAEDDEDGDDDSDGDTDENSDNNIGIRRFG